MAVLTTDYTDFFLKSESSVVQLETIELSHPNFSKTYYLVRNAINGLTAQIEGSVTKTFDYYPLRIEKKSVEDDLDTGLTIEFGDLGEVVPAELDLIQAADNFTTKPKCKYRLFRSDDLTAPMFGPIELEITEFTFNKTGVKFEAHAPLLNISRTGEAYSLDRFPMLRSFL